jgi:thioredoxin-like negative regulator of GroEL
MLALSRLSRWLALAALVAPIAGALPSLNGSTLEAFVALHSAAAVFFYAPWCDHSRAMLPAVEAAANDVRVALEAHSGGKTCGFAQVDASAHDELATIFGIEGYPTLLLLDAHGRGQREFRAERTAAAISAWAIHQLEPRLLVVQSAAEARALVASGVPTDPPAAVAPSLGAAIALIPPGHSPALLDALRLAAAELESITWAHYPLTDAAAVGAELAGEPLVLPALVLLPAVGGAPSWLSLAEWDTAEAAWRLTHSGGFAAALHAATAADGEPSVVHQLGARLAEWADAHAFPPLTPYTTFNSEHFFSQRADLFAMLAHARPTPPSAAQQRADAAAGVAGLAAEVLDTVGEAARADGVLGAIAHASISLVDFPEFSEYLGLARPAAAGAHELPALAVVQPGTGKKWVRALRAADGAALTAAELADWLRAVRYGAVEPSLRSAPPLSPPHVRALGKPGVVTEIVGAEFGRAVLEAAHAVLVYTYAPWCGHCARFEPVFRQVASLLEAAGADVVLVQLDGTANELPGVQVSAYPAIHLYTKAHAAAPIEFVGMRTSAELVNFVLAELGDVDDADADEHAREGRRVEPEQPSAWAKTEL